MGIYKIVKITECSDAAIFFDNVTFPDVRNIFIKISEAAISQNTLAY